MVTIYLSAAVLVFMGAFHRIAKDIIKERGEGEFGIQIAASYFFIVMVIVGLFCMVVVNK